LCSIVAACISSYGVCAGCRAAARHSVHTPQPETHATTILHNLNDVFLLITSTEV